MLKRVKWTMGVMALVASLLMAAGCGGGDEVKAPADPMEAVRQAMKAQLANAPFRSTMETESEGVTSTVVVDFVSSEQMAMDMGELKFRIVDGKSWVSTEGTWEENPIAANAVNSSSSMFTAEGIEQLLGFVTEAKLVGEEEINGEPARVYEYTTESDMIGFDATALSKMWVRKSDGLPVRMEATSTVDDVETTMVSNIEYDKSIKVEAPE
jgi:outer membrane lipoprotein-sorting protein